MADITPNDYARAVSKKSKELHLRVQFLIDVLGADEPPEFAMQLIDESAKAVAFWLEEYKKAVAK
mgnify:CR=1 FL=1|jgi:hypothetical protein